MYGTEQNVRFCKAGSNTSGDLGTHDKCMIRFISLSSNHLQQTFQIDREGPTIRFSLSQSARETN